ncbi:MAG TPA: zinc ribbon domain-containing protein [Vicinamibacteria bacterium]|nr:zinc ribbon domain-containing protein [Vicinamibacteria bacterium]
MTTTTTTVARCPECNSERPDMSRVCDACGAPPAGSELRGASPLEGVRAADIEPYVALRYIARLFKVLAVLILFMLLGEVVLGLLIDGRAALTTLLGEATRLLVLAGMLWAAGDIAVLMIDAGHDLRVARILLGRINARQHQETLPPREEIRREPATAEAPRRMP